MTEELKNLSNSRTRESDRTLSLSTRVLEYLSCFFHAMLSMICESASRVSFLGLLARRSRFTLSRRNWRSAGVLIPTSCKRVGKPSDSMSSAIRCREDSGVPGTQQNSHLVNSAPHVLGPSFRLTVLRCHP